MIPLLCKAHWISFLKKVFLYKYSYLLTLAFDFLNGYIVIFSCIGQLGHLELWYLVIPGFCLFGLFWAICHIILLITIWGFHTKLTDCQKAWWAHPSSRRSLDQVMASRGIRHFCLISERLVFFSLLSTIILGAVSWQVGYMGLKTLDGSFTIPWKVVTFCHNLDVLMFMEPLKDNLESSHLNHPPYRFEHMISYCSPTLSLLCEANLISS